MRFMIINLNCSQFRASGGKALKGAEEEPQGGQLNEKSGLHHQEHGAERAWGPGEWVGQLALGASLEEQRNSVSLHQSPQELCLHFPLMGGAGGTSANAGRPKEANREIGRESEEFGGK